MLVQTILSRLALAVTVSTVCPACSAGADSTTQKTASQQGAAAGALATPTTPAPLIPQPNRTPLAPPGATPEEQAAFMKSSADAAWAFVRRNYQPNTGLMVAHENYQFVTMWDVASTLAAYYAARDLGYLSDEEYRSRMTRVLQTLNGMALFDGAGFNKLYDSKSGAMADRAQHRTDAGYGWSALDIGRLLVWLKLVEQRDSSLAPAVRQVVGRLALSKMVNGGYLQGRDVDPETKQVESYPEGRVGYEQYAAEGFAAWGVQAAKALDFKANGAVKNVEGYTIIADKRGEDLLTSEPFVMMGMELGWRTDDWRNVSRLVFDAQQQRFTKTGIMTMLSEDALPDPPAYFYYYLLYRDGHTFVVRTPTGGDAPANVRWISTKAAFGWHALLPSDYTWNSLQSLRRASSDTRGWASGVYEHSKTSTGIMNLNTAAVVLESALYAKRGCAFVEASCPSKAAGQ